MVAGLSTYLPQGADSMAHSEAERALRGLVAVQSHHSGFSGAQGRAAARFAALTHKRLYWLTSPRHSCAE